jgi:hypothetical protein
MHKISIDMITRHGTAELFGFDLAALPPERIRRLSSAKNKDIPCPFKGQAVGKLQSKCSKEGGVCSLRKCHRAIQNQPLLGGSKPATLRRGVHITFSCWCKSLMPARRQG